MLNCKEASALASRALNQRLPLMQRLSLKFHLMMCHGCSGFFRQITFLRRASEKWQHQGENELPKLSAAARQKISAAIRHFHSGKPQVKDQ